MLSDEIKELKRILRDKWVAEWDKGMYYTPNATGIDLYLDDFTTKALQLEKQLAEKDKVLKENYLLKLFIKLKDPNLITIMVEDKIIELPVIEEFKGHRHKFKEMKHE